MIKYNIVSKCTRTRARHCRLQFSISSPGGAKTDCLATSASNRLIRNNSKVTSNGRSSSSSSCRDQETTTSPNAAAALDSPERLPTGDEPASAAPAYINAGWGEPVQTPCFMPVATSATIKTLTPARVADCGYRLILANTYHLAEKFGHKTLELFYSQYGAVKGMMSWPYYLLTDSGGFQLVSLNELMTINDDGVLFTSPFKTNSEVESNTGEIVARGDGEEKLVAQEEPMFLSPEKSMEIQTLIGSDIIMQLDDVIPSTCEDRERIQKAVARSADWLERASNFLQNENHKRLISGSKSPCINGHLFPIVQGGLDQEMRMESLRQILDQSSPKEGYAIGGLSGGESKSEFCDVVFWCCEELPKQKPRYVMGVGYMIDQLLGVALGADMFDCVFPTRTARFGNALTLEETVNLKKSIYATDCRPICEYCECYTCSSGYTRAFLHYSLGEVATKSLITIHNLYYHHNCFIKKMHEAIDANKFVEFAADCLIRHFTSKDKIPEYVYHCFDDILKVNIDNYLKC
ncbi:MAG: hypothetical protein MHMPM18_002821 [Marteilia pararefringens]